jgi:hypothetical protein
MGRERERENRSYTYLIVGLIVAILTFAFLLAAFGIVLNGNISVRNLISYIVTAISFGVISGTFHYFRLFVAFWLFILGRVFLVNDFGWNDLVGLMAFFSYVVIGFFAGLFFQAIHYLYKLYKAKRQRPPEIK